MWVMMLLTQVLLTLLACMRSVVTDSTADLFTMEYTVCKVTSDEDKRLIRDFLYDHFIPDVPLLLAFGIEKSPPPRGPAPRSPPGDFSLKAVDSQGQIIGVAMNKVNPDFDTDSDPPPEEKSIHDFMDFIEDAAKLKDLPERTIVLSELSVRQDWRRRGVAKRLVEESVKEARNAGFAAMRMCCSNEYVARIARSQGWRERYRIALKDYPKLSGREVNLKPVPPHEFVYYYVTDL